MGTKKDIEEYKSLLDEEEIIEIKDSKENEEKDISPEHIPLVPKRVEEDLLKKKLRDQEKKLRENSGKIEPLVITKSGTIKKASSLNKIEQKEEFVKCALNPIYFIETYLTIFDQTQGSGGKIVPFKLFEFQKDLICSYVDHRFNIANKYRQAGISTTTCAYIAWYIMFNEHRTAAIVADKLETARDELMNDVVMFIDGCPEFLKPKTGKDTGGKYKDTQKLKRYDNGSALGAFSSKGLRGITPTLLFWDETAWTEKSGKFWTAAYPTLQTGGRAIMVSTPSGMDEVFYKTFIVARNKKNQFNAIELWWFNDPRYNKDLVWLKNKGKENEIKLIDENWNNAYRIKLMDDGWTATSPWFEEQVMNANGDMKRIAQEILCSFLGSGDNFIAEEFLKRIEEKEVKVPIRQEYIDKNMWIFEDPVIGEEYVIALDVSAGHGDDNSSINILKLNHFIEEKNIVKNNKSKKVKIKKCVFEQVAEYYGKVTPQMLAEIAYQYGKAYNYAYCVIDITGGYGVHTIEKLLEFGYSNIHYAEVSHKPTRDRLQGYIKKGQKTMADGTVIDVDLIPGFFIGNNRASVLLEMQRSIHLGEVIIHSIRLYDELKTFITVPGNRVADHKRSFHDDSIMGLSIGLYVVNYDMAKFKQDKGLTEKLIDSMIKINTLTESQTNKSKKNINVIVSPNSSSPLNPYIANSWLFNGLKQK